MPGMVRTWIVRMQRLLAVGVNSLAVDSWLQIKEPETDDYPYRNR